jgi:hypothetical protein
MDITMDIMRCFHILYILDLFQNLPSPNSSIFIQPFSSFAAAKERLALSSGAETRSSCAARRSKASRQAQRKAQLGK